MMKMVNQDSYELLQGAYGYLCSKIASFDKNVVVFNPEQSILLCEYDDRFGERISVGIKEFISDLSGKMPMGKALVPVVGLYHEVCGHGGQTCLQFQKTDDLSLSLALNKYACSCSSYYYEGFGADKSKQYWNQPYEIAAQYMGILTVYQFLSTRYDDNTANKMICAYENYRMSTGHSFVKRFLPYRDASDILCDLNAKFQDVVLKHREYSVRDIRRFPNKDADSVYQYASILNRMDYVQSVEQCLNGLKQDAMVLACGIRFCGNRSFLRQPVVQKIDLDIDTVFERD